MEHMIQPTFTIRLKNALGYMNNAEKLRDGYEFGTKEWFNANGTFMYWSGCVQAYREILSMVNP